MTTTTSVHVACRNCGAISEQIVVQSTFSVGLPDLDFRPPLPERYSLRYQVQMCPHCRYCAPDISTGEKEGKHVVNSEEYQSLFLNKVLPDLANRFIAMAKLMEVMNKPYLTYSGYHSAAWICDDHRNSFGMMHCRKLALESLKKMHSTGKRISGDAGVDELICSDLMRRAAQFDAAYHSVKTGLKTVSSEIIKEALLFELDLINCWDTLSYRFDQIPDILEILHREYKRIAQTREEYIEF